jgi:hypothetical protein
MANRYRPTRRSSIVDQFYANALQDALRKANARRKETLAALTRADWRLAVYREMQADYGTPSLIR